MRALRSTLSLLPAPLLALLFALPILSAHTSTNDPFRALSANLPKVTQDPVCCLKPLPPLEPQPGDEELLLSFEDWKAKLLADEKSNGADNDSGPRKDTIGSGNGGKEGGGSESPTSAGGSSTLTLVGSPQDHLEPIEQLSPHFRVPLTDRFNYANLDCSARVHTSHRSAKSASSILSSKKDRYMLSPCSSDGNGDNHFVIVELCDDIRIDTVQLANFEFFSGVFKDLTVSVAKTYTVEPEGWTTAGTYRAKNIRGVQSFHPPTHLRDFYRYIRIDFHSHYGSEYYCPVSLLRVFGLTHLEEWKWDIWEAESKAKRIGQLSASIDASHAAQEEYPISSIFTQVIDTAASLSSESHSSSVVLQSSLLADLQHKNSTGTLGGTPDAASPSSTPDISQPESSVRPPASDDSSPKAGHEMQNEQTTTPEGRRFPSTDLPQPTTLGASLSFGSPINESSMTYMHHGASITSDASSILTSRSSSFVSSSGTTTPIISLASQASLSPPHSSPGSGESIYRTIMNRLTVLELNTTLYTRYVEEQTAGIREVLRRLNEDVGRLEGISKAQAQMYQRSLLEMERQKRRLELEHGELMYRVNYLAQEVVMEKRLGIAQLCVLVAVLVFMALTRGSRGELEHKPAILQRFSRGNSWGQRTLSFSGDWVSRFRSRSPTAKSVDVNPPRPDPGQIEFPTRKATSTQTFTQRTVPAPTSPIIRRTAVARPRTPSARTPARHVVRPSTPTRAHPMPPPLLLRPIIARSNSYEQSASGSNAILVGPAPKSARKWARTAHLHHVKPDSRVGDARALRVNVDLTKVTPRGIRLAVDEQNGRKSSPLRTVSPTTENGGILDREESDVWVDTDEASSDTEFVQENRHTGSSVGSVMFSVGA